jgi:hypothetical protein
LVAGAIGKGERAVDTRAVATVVAFNGVAVAVVLLEWAARESWAGSSGDGGLIERNGNDLVTADIAHVAEFDGDIGTRLPLNVEGVVDGVGQLVSAVVYAEGDGLAVVDHSGSAVVVVHDAVRVGKVVA